MGEIPCPILISILHRWVQYLGYGYDRPLESRNAPPAIGPELFGSSADAWYVMYVDFLNGTLRDRFHGWYQYQSFIDGSNVWLVDGTDPWGPEFYNPPLGRSYLVGVSSFYVSCPLIIFTLLYGWDSMADIDLNPLSRGQIIRVWIGPTLGVSKWTIHI